MILTVTLNAAIDKRYVVEGFRVGEVNRVKECAYTPGGKGLNVSKPASIAGAEVVATGFVGGHAGHYIEDSLKPFGIRSEFYHLADESRSCINIWDEVNHVQTEFLEPGFTVTEEDFVNFEEKFKGLVAKADVVSMSGSVPKGLDGRAYQRLVKICKEAGKPVILDTSGNLLEMGIEACPTMIKPNIDEIRMLTGKACDHLEDMVEAADRRGEHGGVRRFHDRRICPGHQRRPFSKGDTQESQRHFGGGSAERGDGILCKGRYGTDPASDKDHRTLIKEERKWENSLIRPSCRK